jgi:DNA-binding MarR family transcriptional regulator
MQTTVGGSGRAAAAAGPVASTTTPLEASAQRSVAPGIDRPSQGLAAASEVSVRDVVRDLNVLNMASDRLRGVLASQLQINPIDLRAMSVIAAGEQVTPKDVAAALDITTGSVTPLVDRLAHKGLAMRTPHPADRRSLVLTLTPAGEHARRWAAEFYEAAVASAVEALQIPLEAIHQLLHSVSREIDTSTDRLTRSVPALNEE